VIIRARAHVMMFGLAETMHEKAMLESTFSIGVAQLDYVGILLFDENRSVSIWPNL
jgi:hypothetical protein